MNIETPKELANLASPEFKFSGPVEITGVSAQHVDLFNKGLESAAALTTTAGQAVLSGLGVTLATGSGLVGGLVGAGVAINHVFSGSKKTGREV